MSGMKTCPAIARTVSTVVARSSWLAVMSKNVISSAPHRSAWKPDRIPGIANVDELHTFDHATAVAVERNDSLR